MSRDSYYLEAIGRIEFRRFAIGKLYEELTRRSGLDRIIDQSTGREHQQMLATLKLLKDQVKDKESIGLDASNDVDAIKKLNALIKTSADE